MNKRIYMGMEFEVWGSGRGWFWMVADPRTGRAAIGSCANERGAISEACSSIDEIGARLAAANGTSTAGPCADPIRSAADRWNAVLERLERYLCGGMREFAPAA
jgi:hypothetical protein